MPYILQSLGSCNVGTCSSDTFSQRSVSLFCSSLEIHACAQRYLRGGLSPDFDIVAVYNGQRVFDFHRLWSPLTVQRVKPLNLPPHIQPSGLQLPVMFVHDGTQVLCGERGGAIIWSLKKHTQLQSLRHLGQFPISIQYLLFH